MTMAKSPTYNSALFCFLQAFSTEMAKSKSKLHGFNNYSGE